LADYIIGTAFGVVHPPILHIFDSFGFFVSVQFFAHIAKSLMVSEPSGIKIAPPEIFVEFGVISVQEF
jgi:hypothetical protein